MDFERPRTYVANVGRVQEDDADPDYENLSPVQAQARFRRAVDLIVELANLAARMDAARRRYEGLQAELSQ